MSKTIQIRLDSARQDRWDAAFDRFNANRIYTISDFVRMMVDRALKDGLHRNKLPVSSSERATPAAKADEAAAKRWDTGWGNSRLKRDVPPRVVQGSNDE